MLLQLTAALVLSLTGWAVQDSKSQSFVQLRSPTCRLTPMPLTFRAIFC